MNKGSVVKFFLSALLAGSAFATAVKASDQSELISLSLRELMHIPLRVDAKKNRIYEDKANPVIDNAIIFGVMAPVSLYPEYGTQIVAAADLAAAKINQWGGIKGKKLVILRGDDQENTPISAQVAEQMVTQYNVQAIIGPATSNSVRDVIDKVVKPMGIPLISQAATSLGLLERANYKNVWLMPASNQFHARLILDYAHKRHGHNKIYVFANKTLFSDEIISALKSMAETETNVLLESTQISELVHIPSMDLSNDIHKIQEQGFSTIVLTLNNDQMIPMIKKIAQYWRGKFPLIVITDTMKPNDLNAADVGDIKHCVVTYLSVGNSQNMALNKQIQSLLDIGYVGYDAAYVFDATVILAMAKKLQLTFGLSIDDAVEAITGNGYQVSIEDYPRIERLYRKYGELSFAGYSGRVWFNEQGENIAARLKIIELESGEKKYKFCEIDSKRAH